MAINCDDAGVQPHLLPVIAGARNLLTVTDSTAAQGSLAVADIVYVSRLKSHWADRVIMERVIRTVAWVVTERCLQKVLVLLLYTAPSNVHPTLPCLAGLWGLHLALARQNNVLVFVFATLRRVPVPQICTCMSGTVIALQTRINRRQVVTSQLLAFSVQASRHSHGCS